MLRKLAEYVRPKRNVVFERHRFFSRNQKEHKPFDRWLKDLQLIAKNCEFAEEYNIIRDKIEFIRLKRSTSACYGRATWC